MEELFTEGFASAERFFSRLPELDVTGKSVLDFGCGLGSAYFLAAERGAQRVLSIDIQSVDFARQKLQSNFARFGGTVEFRQIEPDGADLGGELFDLVVSKDTFEHVGIPMPMSLR